MHYELKTNQEHSMYIDCDVILTQYKLKFILN